MTAQVFTIANQLTLLRMLLIPLFVILTLYGEFGWALGYPIHGRENEQALLRRGMIPPRHLPSAHRQRPHFVADIYRRQGAPA